MVELRASSGDTIPQSFAGDAYNSAVYLKRSFASIAVSMITAIGKDRLSSKLLDTIKSEDIDTRFVFRHESKAPGIYLIETDDHGERSFTYWRDDSAAKKVVEFLDEDAVSQLSSGDMLFFSGISLAVIDETTRDQFWAMLASLKSAGVTLVFDPNYRARLWKTSDDAKAQFLKAFHVSDIALPGVEDFISLFQIDSAGGVIEFCQTFDIDELVVKNGPKSVVTFLQGDCLEHTISPVDNVVDTTSAGDAFNGVYLGARLMALSIEESVQLAAKAAATVIQHPGAIIPKQAFQAAVVET